MAGDLEGILVVSVEQAVAAPYASGRLADAGARVIKIERPEGDFARNYDSLVEGHSAYFVWLNRGKDSIALDLKQEADLALLRRIIGSADVLIQNLAPGAMERMGLGAQDLHEAHPALIICGISGYGTQGPLKDLKAYDLLVQAESGLVEINGTGEARARVGVSVCDIAAGMTAFQAILQALIARGRTGKGRIIEVSLFHAMADWMNVPYLQHRYGRRTPERCGLNHPTIAPYGAYACADGRAILISIQNEREWRLLCETVMGMSDLADDPRFDSNEARVANRPALDAIIETVFAHHSRDAMADILREARIAYGRLSSLDDLARHPQARFITVQAGDAEIELLAPGAVVQGRSLEPGPVPAVDANGAAIRREFGD